VDETKLNNKDLQELQWKNNLQKRYTEEDLTRRRGGTEHTKEEKKVSHFHAFAVAKSPLDIQIKK